MPHLAQLSRRATTTPTSHAGSHWWSRPLSVAVSARPLPKVSKSSSKIVFNPHATPDLDLHRTIGGRVTKRRASSGAKLAKKQPTRSRSSGDAVHATRSQTRLSQGRWPAKDLYFKTFPKDEAYTYLFEILKERGWKYAGNPYKGTDASALKKIVKAQEKLPRFYLTADCSI